MPGPGPAKFRQTGCIAPAGGGTWWPIVSLGHAPTHRFSLDLTRSGGTTVVAVAGEVDALTATTLRACLTDLVDTQGDVFLLVDLTATTVVDPSTGAVFADIDERLRANGGQLRVTDHPRR